MQRVAPGRYKHFKGNFYIVLGMVKNSENPGDVDVLYQSEKDGTFWRRPAAQFNDCIEQSESGCTMYRFTKVEDKPMGTVGLVMPPDEVHGLVERAFFNFRNVEGMPIQLVACTPENFFFQFRDVEEDKLYEVTSKEQAMQGFVAFAREVSAGRLIGLGIEALTDIDSYSAYALSVLIQFIIFGRLVYA